MSEADQPRDAGSADRGAPFSRLHRFRWVCFALLFSIFSYYFFTQDVVTSNVASTRVHGDGIYYYVYLRSLVFDRDVDFKNDYKMFGNHFDLGKSDRGRATNCYAMGAAVFWAPFQLAAHAIVGAGKRLGMFDDPMDGTSWRYQRIVFFGSLCWGFIALLLTILLAQRFSSSGLAMTAAFGLALATPLGWYMLRQTPFSHAISAAAVALFVYFWHRTLFTRKLWQWALLGIFAGLLMLVRTQNVGHIILPLGEWLMIAGGMMLRKELRKLIWLSVSGIVFTLSALLAFMPQFMVWKWIYGEWFFVPQGEDFMLWEHSKWVEVLFSSCNGLLAWNPLISLSIVGLFLLALRGPRRHARITARLMLLAFACQVYINGCVDDWWAGWAFGGRRFMGCTIYFGVGLAAFMWFIRPLLARATRWVVAAAPVLIIGCFTLFNLTLMDDYADGKAKRAASQPMADRWKNTFTKIYDKLYDKIGNLGSIPANWIFALKADISPASYDAISGVELLTEEARASVYFHDERFVMGGFGEITAYDGNSCRWVAGDRATFVIPLRKPQLIVGSVTLRPARPRTRVRLELPGKTLVDRELENKWRSYSFTIPASALRPGLNYFTIRQTLPARRSWPLGKTGRMIRQEVQVNSAGYRMGNQAAFHFGDEEVEVKFRGVTAYTFAGDGSGYDKIGSFDSYRSVEETKRFVRAIRVIPRGTLVALTVRDEASNNWTRAGDQALRSLGGRTSLMKKNAWRSSYALIGMKGAKPGQAAEAFSKSSVVTAVVGRHITHRIQGVAWSRITLISKEFKKKKKK